MMRISSTPQSCLASEAGDSESFANASAINDKYLAVGDPEANRVVVYTRDAKGKWLRSREILPPEGSEAEAVGFGFGYDVSLDGSTLVIGAYGSKRNPKIINYTEADEVWLTVSEIYKTTLDKEAEVERIDITSKGEIPSGLVSADNGKIVYSTHALEKGARFRVYLYEDGNIKKSFVSPTVVKDFDRTGFGNSIALKNNFLIVGSPGEKPRGAAWLFNLEAPSAKPRRLAIPNKTSRRTVAISEHFAAVGVRNPFQLPSSTETLVVSIEDGSTTLVEGVGKLSSDGNILAMMLPYVSRGGYTQRALLRVYDLTDINKPRQIVKRRGIDDAYVQNNFLTTIQKFRSRTKTKICTEQVVK